MKKLMLSTIAEAVGGKCTGECEITGICIDNRLAGPGMLYVAIKGENHDGHDFAKSALENGAQAAMISHDINAEGTFIRVADTHKALMTLAHWFRCEYNIPVVGLTGSVGKTTTKEMTWCVLNQAYNTIKTEGNLNNNIGLPRTVLTFEDDTQAAVIEMGMSNSGEISELSRIAEPTLAIITNIGVSHMENLGSRENILKAKLEITDGLRSGCPVILNGDDAYLVSADVKDHPVIYYGIDNPTCDFRAENVIQTSESTCFDVLYGQDKKCSIRIPTVGIHNVYNALAAFAAGLNLGVTADQAALGLEKYIPSGMRQRVRVVNDIRFIEDCYNASPDSQRAALKTLSSLEAERRIAVLGDMLELGQISEDCHKNAGLLAAKNKVDILYTYGPNSLATAENATKCGVPDVRAFLIKEELADDLFSTLRKGDAVLFKASRGMALEDVINNIYSRMQ